LVNAEAPKKVEHRGVSRGGLDQVKVKFLVGRVTLVLLQRSYIGQYVM